MLLLLIYMSAFLQAQFLICVNMHLKQFCVHKILCTNNYNCEGLFIKQSLVKDNYFWVAPRVVVFCSFDCTILWVKTENDGQ